MENFKYRSASRLWAITDSVSSTDFCFTSFIIVRLQFLLKKDSELINNFHVFGFLKNTGSL